MNRRHVIAVLRAAAARLMAKPVRLDAALVEKLKKELRQMTKLYKSIVTDSTPEAVEHFKYLEKLFMTYHDTIEEIVNDQILGQMPGGNLASEDASSKDSRSWAANELAKTAWDFLHTIRVHGLFPDQYSRDLDKPGVPMKDTYIPAPWALANKVDKKIRAYQRTALPFFKALEDFIAHETTRGAPLDRVDAIEKTSFAGMNIVIHNKGRFGPSDDADIEGQTKHFFEHQHDSVAMVKRAGFGSSLDGLTLHMGFTTPRARGGDSAAGTYQESRDELWVHRLSFFDENDPGHTFVHEVGHRFYYKKLPPAAIKHWDDVIKDRLTFITPEIIDKWIDHGFGPAFLKLPDYGHIDSQEVKKLGERFAETLNEEEAAQIRFLSESHPVYPRTLEGFREHHVKFHIGEKVAVEHITDYGATNPQEAFAEAFRLYITKGPGALGPWTRQFFKEITRSGGAKLRSAAKP